MATLINKDKQISKQRQDFVEHNFEAMVGARKRRYNETPQQKQRTEFLEDYYLLYTRNKQELDQQKARIEELESQFAYECECNKQFVQLQNMWNELKEWVGDNSIENNDSIDPLSTKIEQLFIAGKLASFEDIKNKMQELEKGEKDD